MGKMGKSYRPRFNPYGLSVGDYVRAAQAGWEAGKTIKKKFNDYMTGSIPKEGDPGFISPMRRPENYAPTNHTLNIRSTAENPSTVEFVARRKRKRYQSKKTRYRKRKWKSFRRKVRKALKKRLTKHVYVLPLTGSLTTTIPAAGTVYEGTAYDPELRQITFPTSNAAVTSSTYAAMMVGAGNVITTTRGVALLEPLFDNTGWVENGAIATNAYGRKIGFSYREYAYITWDIAGVGLAVFNADNPLVVDIFECVATRDIADSNYDWPTDHAFIYGYGANNEYFDPTGAGISSIRMSTKTVTPWDFPGYKKYWKVIKKTRYNLTSSTGHDDDGAETDRTPTMHYLLQTKGYYTDRKYSQLNCVKGVTKAIFFVINPLHSYDWLATDCTLNLKCCKKFHIQAPANLTSGNTYAATSTTAI